MSHVGEITIVPIEESHMEGLRRCLDAVARERRYIGLVEGPTLEQTKAFRQRLEAAGGVQFVAIDPAGEVIGWCDIQREEIEGFRHCGRFGMGLASGVRGRGIGRRLAEAVIEAGFARGLERIELEVFASNETAIRLYERLGFVHEGVKRHSRKLDGRYDDSVFMALIRPKPA